MTSKLLPLIIISLLNISYAFSQVPPGFQYQGTARGLDGTPISNQSISIQISINQDAADGTSVYRESHAVTTSDLGHFSLTVGDGLDPIGTFEDISWGTGNYYLAVALDLSGGSDFENIGSNRLLSVPYAMYAASSGTATGSTGHEWNGTMLRFQNSDGTWGAFTDLQGPPGADGQNGEKGEKGDKGEKGEKGDAGSGSSYTAGNGIDISGNTISLNHIDDDTDPTNELQSLSYDQLSKTLSLSGTEGIVLPFDTLFTRILTASIPPRLVRMNANVHLHADDLSSLLFSTNTATANFEIFVGAEEAGSAVPRLHLQPDNMHFEGSDTDEFIFIDPNSISWLDGMTLKKDKLSITAPVPTGSSTEILALQKKGLYLSEGDNGFPTVRLEGSPHGRLELLSGFGSRMLNTSINSDNAPFFQLFGQSGKLNINLNSLNGFPDHGYLAVGDASGDAQAGMYVDAGGQGVVFGDIMSFSTASNERADQEIVYSTVQGPEVAVYHRGTGTLKNGVVEIVLPGHFREVADITTMTIQLTPLYANTYGLAVVEKTKTGFQVSELMNGTGNFAFDYEIKCSKKGFTDWQVLRTQKVRSSKGL